MKLKYGEKLEEEKEYFWATDGDKGLTKLLLNSNKTMANFHEQLSQVLRKQERSTHVTQAWTEGL